MHMYVGGRNVYARFASVWLISASCWVLHLSPSPPVCLRVVCVDTCHPPPQAADGE